jgi:YVTN family beta-propeller protein
VAGPLGHLVFVANRDSNDVAVINARTDRVIKRVKVGARPHMTIVAANGRTYTTGSGSDDLTVIDGMTLKIVGRVKTRAKGPEHGTVSPDGRWLYVANVEGRAVTVVDLAANKVAAVIGGLAHPHNILFSADGRRAYVTQVGSYRVALVDTATHRVTGDVAAGSPVRLASLTLPKIQGVNNAVLVPGRSLVFATNQDAGEVAVIEDRTGAMAGAIPVGRQPWEPYATPDGRLVLVPNLADETVSVIDAAARRVVATLPGGKEMTGAVISADSRKAYLVRRGDGLVSVLDLERLAVAKEIAVGRNPEVASRTADGEKVYVANSGSNDVTVIATATDTVAGTIRNVGRYPWAVTAAGGYNYCH